MENRSKEQQLDLFADRTSTHTLRANQLRRYFSSFAYMLLCALRRLGLQDSDLPQAQCGTNSAPIDGVGIPSCLPPHPGAPAPCPIS
jgi:hypothetical protein